MADAVLLKLEKCSQCPHLSIGSSYSLDGFDRGSDWTCSKAQRSLQKFVERPSDEPKSIPGWCPLRESDR